MNTKEIMDSEDDEFFLAASSPLCHMLGSAETALLIHTLF